MKKILTAIALTILLAGCATSPNESFLDEKIKCKKLAEERFEKIEDDLGPNWYISDKKFIYNQDLDTCIASHIINGYDWTTFGSTKKIEDICENKVLSSFTYMEAVENYEIDETYLQKQKEFESQFKLYFGEDAI